MSKHAPTEPHALTARQIELLKARLTTERDRLHQAQASMVSVREAPERSAEAMDEAEASLAQHEALGLAAHDRNLLQHVERALKKLDYGTYGVSERSEEPIGFARLEAVPWARFTAAEQEETEAHTRQRAR